MKLTLIFIILSCLLCFKVRWMKQEFLDFVGLVKQYKQTTDQPPTPPTH